MIATIPTTAVYGLIAGGLIATVTLVAIYLNLPPRCPKCGEKQPVEPAYGWRRCNRCNCRYDPVTGERL